MTGSLSLFAKTIIEGAKDIGFTGPTTASNTTIANVLYPVYFWAGVAAVIVIVVAGYRTCGDIPRLFYHRDCYRSV